MKTATIFFTGLLASATAVAFAQSAADVGASGDYQRNRQERSEKAFAETDSNHDGKISSSEWQSAQLRKSQEKFQKLDTDRDGKLSREEMASAREHHRGGRGEGMREHLRSLDTDGDEQLSRAEIGDKAPRLAQDFDRIDTDRDGKLSREEMRAAWPHRGERERDGANPDAVTR